MTTHLENKKKNQKTNSRPNSWYIQMHKNLAVLHRGGYRAISLLLQDSKLQGMEDGRGGKFEKKLSYRKESVSLSAPSPTAFSFHLSNGKNCAKNNGQPAQIQPRVQPAISHIQCHAMGSRPQHQPASGQGAALAHISDG